jgi:hypothetical protein
MGGRGIVVVAAAGNRGASVREYPAAEETPGLLAVAASTPTDTLASFSTFGPWVPVAAPGADILSSVPGGGFGTWSGTSMAAPFAAGQAALVRATYPDLTATEVAQRIVATAAAISGLVPLRIDAAAALGVVDTTPPETTIHSGPDQATTSTNATFTFSASQPGSTFECALDDAEFTACVSPLEYTGLAVGEHIFRVRATDPSGNTDPTPAGYTWTISPPAECGRAVTVFASADSWVDQNSASNNFGTDAILKVRSQGPSDDFRALVRFTLPTAPAGCVVQSATLRLYAASWTTGRALEALRIADPWAEDTVTWSNQPATTGSAATTSSGSGYREWSVSAQVQAIYDTGSNYGFLIRDATEGGGGFEQQFHSHRKGENVPMLVIHFTAADS